MGKFLRILFGCHGRADRSFFCHGKQFPICARCTGELIGILTGIPIAVFMGCASVPVMLLLMAPMAADGLLQLLTPYESGNYRRLVTGFLFGIALIFFLIHFHRTCVRIATEILKLLIDDPEQAERVMEQFI